VGAGVANVWHLLYSAGFMLVSLVFGILIFRVESTHHGYSIENGQETMLCRAFIKKSGRWWIGWLLDLPGVNAQEETREKLVESLRVGAQEMLSTEVPFDPDGQITTVR
jgi:hypothetical protein